MSYHIVYGIPDADPVDGPHLASGSGWLAWCEWVLGYDEYPECHCLAENGWADRLPDLATELDWLLEEQGDEDLRNITQTLQRAVREKPDGATAMVVTDGSPPGDEGEEDDDEDDPE